MWGQTGLVFRLFRLVVWSLILISNHIDRANVILGGFLCFCRFSPTFVFYRPVLGFLVPPVLIGSLSRESRLGLLTGWDIVSPVVSRVKILISMDIQWSRVVKSLQ